MIAKAVLTDNRDWFVPEQYESQSIHRSHSPSEDWVFRTRQAIQLKVRLLPTLISSGVLSPDVLATQAENN